MLTNFLYYLRALGLKVSLTEWLTLMQALCRGYSGASLSVFYQVARAILVKSERHFDTYDRAFASFFRGIETHFKLDDELLNWLQNPVLPKTLTQDEIDKLKTLDLETLRKQFQERMREQHERHDGGSHWIGTGGTSPFGHGGTHPSGIRIGGPGQNRSAVQVAEERKFRDLRGDRVLDTRSIGVALKRLRRLHRTTGQEELDLDATIEASAKAAGDIELVFSAPKRNTMKLLLLMDVGGSMDPHAIRCEQLFSAANATQHFKQFASLFFHNCIYEHLFINMGQGKAIPTDKILEQLDDTWCTIVVGDAAMNPYELTMQGGAIDYRHHNSKTGIWWLKQVRERCKQSVWLNPEPVDNWAETVSTMMVHEVFPMYPLSVDGISEAVDQLRAG